jgi:hypothetical protein
VNWAVRWGGLGVLLLCAGLYLTTAVWAIGVIHQWPGLTAGGGVWRGRVTIVVVVRDNPLASLPAGWSYRVARPAKAADSWSESLRARYRRNLRGAANQREIAVPLWMVALAVTPPCALAWRTRRTTVPHACAACNYDLSGLRPGSACPECAAVPPACPQP